MSAISEVTVRTVLAEQLTMHEIQVNCTDSVSPCSGASAGEALELTVVHLQIFQCPIQGFFDILWTIPCVPSIDSR